MFWRHLCVWERMGTPVWLVPVTSQKESWITALSASFVDLQNHITAINDVLPSFSCVDTQVFISQGILCISEWVSAKLKVNCKKKTKNNER